MGSIGKKSLTFLRSQGKSTSDRGDSGEFGDSRSLA